MSQSKDHDPWRGPTVQKDSLPSNSQSPEVQRREAFANFMAALDARDMPMSMAASFQAGWDACMRRMGAWRAESERQLRSWQDRYAAIFSEPNSAPETKTAQAPIVRVVVANDKIHDAQLYAPGLPAGVHDLFCEPETVAPMMRDETKSPKVVVYKDGTYIFDAGPMWEYENDPDWLVTIDISGSEKAPPEPASKSQERRFAAMAMLSNDHHPGPRCSCRECLSEFPSNGSDAL